MDWFLHVQYYFNSTDLQQTKWNGKLSWTLRINILDGCVMHNLDLGTAFLYWIPAVSILLIMTVFLSLSFLRYRWKKERGRQSQRDYLELDLSTRRPRIGALSCHTHEQHWTELMQSFPVNQMRNMLREYHFEYQHQFGEPPTPLTYSRFWIKFFIKKNLKLWF